MKYENRATTENESIKAFMTYLFAKYHKKNVISLFLI